MSIRTFQYSDRARRCSDTINNHLVGTRFECVGRWAAIRLSDGGSDDVLYDSKSDAIRHQVHETQCAYVSIPLDGMTPRQAEMYLNFTEGLYKAGARLADPDTVIHMPAAAEKQRAVLRAVHQKMRGRG